MAKKNSAEFVKSAIANGVALRGIKGKKEDWTYEGMYILVSRIFKANYAKTILLATSKNELFENFFEPCGNDEYRVITRDEAAKRMRVRHETHHWGKEA